MTIIRNISVDVDVLLKENEVGGYTVLVPGLSSCISEGDNEEEALQNIKDAINLYLEDQSLSDFADKRLDNTKDFVSHEDAWNR